MSEIRRLRRFYLLKRLALARIGDDAMSCVWHGKQEAESGTALPAGFPSKAALAAAGYTTIEDVDGATPDELLDYACLSRSKAEAAIAAAEALI